MARPRPKQQTQYVMNEHSKDGANVERSVHHVNPWQHESNSTANIRRALILAEHMGLNIMEMEDAPYLCPRLAEFNSFKLMSIQKDMTVKRKSLFEANKKLAVWQQERKTSDLTRLDVIAQRINFIEQLCGDLNSVLKNKDRLIKHLQTPFVGDHLKIEAHYHSYVFETFDLVGSTLNEVSHHLDNLNWISNQELSSSHTEPLVVDIQSLTASLQTSYQTLLQVRRGMEQLENNTTLASSSKSL